MLCTNESNLHQNLKHSDWIIWVFGVAHIFAVVRPPWLTASLVRGTCQETSKQGTFSAIGPCSRRRSFPGSFGCNQAQEGPEEGSQAGRVGTVLLLGGTKHLPQHAALRLETYSSSTEKVPRQPPQQLLFPDLLWTEAAAPGLCIETLSNGVFFSLSVHCSWLPGKYPLFHITMGKVCCHGNKLTSFRRVFSFAGMNLCLTKVGADLQPITNCAGLNNLVKVSFK